MRLYDVLVSSAHAALRMQRPDGAFPPGHDGPYGGVDTPVRNTAHWLITLLKAYEIAGEERYSDAALRASRYLRSGEARPMNASFFCRRDPEKDLSNGLIGQAWVIEALVTAADGLSQPECRQLAEELFLLHPFVEQHALWRSVNVDGSYSVIDLTFNHQLWFAATGMAIAGSDSESGKRVLTFLDAVDQSHLRIARTGRIRHALRQPSRPYGIAKLVYDWRHPRSQVSTRRDQVEKAIGYHAFNLYAFALLRASVPKHSLWNSEMLGKALGYVGTDEYVKGLEHNKYAYPYNPPGFEVAFAQQVFASAIPRLWTPEMWVTDQLRRTFDFDTGLMTRRAPDPQTQAARLYEATRLENLQLHGWPETR